MDKLLGLNRHPEPVRYPQVGQTTYPTRSATDEVVRLLDQVQTNVAGRPVTIPAPPVTKPWLCNSCKAHMKDGDIRYKCLVCPDIDLCERCEMQQPNPAASRDGFTHPLEHPVVKLHLQRAAYGHYVQDKSKLVHENIRCNGCQAMPIVGFRYKCAVCSNFDICELCETRREHPDDHPLLKIMVPLPVATKHY